MIPNTMSLSRKFNQNEISPDNGINTHSHVASLPAGFRGNQYLQRQINTTCRLQLISVIRQSAL